MSHDDEVLLTGGGSTAVHRRGDVVLRPARPWTPAVQDLLGHVGARWMLDHRTLLERALT